MCEGGADGGLLYRYKHRPGIIRISLDVQKLYSKRETTIPITICKRGNAVTNKKGSEMYLSTAYTRTLNSIRIG